MTDDNFDTCLKSMQIYNVVVLNLKNRPDRLAFMKFKLNNVNINKYQVFEAVNGYTDENIKMYEKYRTLNKEKKQFIQSPGAMGCIMSYKKLFNCYLNDPNFKKNDKLFILEDDVNFHKNFVEKLLEQSCLIKKSDVVYVGANQLKWLPFNTTKKHYKVFTQKYYTVYGTFGFMINRKSMSLIYKELDKNPAKFTVPIDYLQWLMIVRYKLTANVLYPNLLIADVTDSDNMGPRNMIDFAKQRRWDLSLYNYVYENTKFYRIYNCMCDCACDCSYIFKTCILVTCYLLIKTAIR